MPKKCGIATYSNDLYKSLKQCHISNIDIIAIDNQDFITYPNEVKFTIDKNDISHYDTASNFINLLYDVCIIEHEYGIFGGVDGDYILHLIKNIHIPIITNFHPLFNIPSINQKKIIQELANKSAIIKLLIKKAINLKIQDKVIFIDEFASEEKLKTYLSATDMYVTPYPN